MFEDWFYLIAWLRKEQLRGAGRAAARVPSRSNAKQPAYARGGWNSDIHAILRPIQRGMLRFTGFEVLAPNLCFGPARTTPEQRTQWLRDYEVRLRGITDEKPIDAGEY